MKDYRTLQLSKSNIDIYYPLVKKLSLLKYISKNYFVGDLLDIGCGEMPYKNMILEESKIRNYVGVDIINESYQHSIKPDLFWNGEILPIENSMFDCGMLIEVLEHVKQPELILKEASRVIKQNGYLIITVPFLWPLHDVPYDEYRYTPFSLKRIVETSGFEIKEMEAFGGWHASLATMLALYCRRALSGRKRNMASTVLKPVISYLYKKDEKLDKTNFNKGHMLTGLWCLAQVKNK